MGVELTRYYDEAGRLGGIAARVALATYTALSSKQASEAVDSPELMKKFEQALQKIRTEYKASSVPSVPTSAAGASPRVNPDKLQTVLKALERGKSRYISDLKRTTRHVTETAANELNIARVSVWFLEHNNTLIECIDLFERPLSRHSTGLKLFEKDYPAYFKALKYARAIDAHDANSDWRTSCFSKPYLQPLGIASMLDIPIWHQGELKGVLCHEHIGDKRQWTFQEADFGVELAGFVSQALAPDK